MKPTTEEQEAYIKPIKEGFARILLKLQPIECEVENLAPDFVSVEDDDVFLTVQPNEEADIEIPELETQFALKFERYLGDGNTAKFKLSQTGIWFDIQVDHVTDVWIADLDFRIRNKHERYLSYYIKTLNHQLEWLQPDIKTGEISSMSVSTKKFKPPKISGKESFTAQEVIRCADMIGRSVRKIDIRTGGAYVKFNTDKGRLEPLIISIADKLGYIIEPLDKEVIRASEDDGKNVSHAIYLKKI